MPTKSRRLTKDHAITIYNISIITFHCKNGVRESNPPFSGLPLPPPIPRTHVCVHLECITRNGVEPLSRHTQAPCFTVKLLCNGPLVAGQAICSSSYTWLHFRYQVNASILTDTDYSSMSQVWDDCKGYSWPHLQSSFQSSSSNLSILSLSALMCALTLERSIFILSSPMYEELISIFPCSTSSTLIVTTVGYISFSLYRGA